jgi:hypothetical protein
MGFVKKLFSYLLVGTVVVAFGVVGCSSTTTAPATTTKPAETTKETTKASGDTKTVDGKFVSFKDDELKIKDDKDKEQTYKAKDVKPMLDGKEVKWDEIKEGMKGTITTDKDGKMATKAEFKK